MRESERDMLYVVLAIPAVLALIAPARLAAGSSWPVPALTVFLVLAGLRPGRIYPIPQIVAEMPAVYAAVVMLPSSQSLLQCWLVAATSTCSAMLAELRVRSFQRETAGYITLAMLPLPVALLLSSLLELPAPPITIKAPREAALGIPLAAALWALSLLPARGRAPARDLRESRIRGLKLIAELLGVEVSLAEAEEGQES
ncbi:MAG: hypothetical protein DRN96_09005 [Thermoproteota archaeon]|nr:MAG: hypothetical protein DRN96_09005 [Candidatus Korarchaeota archaeon]RLG51453.1 MAG: hypothetical protein DRN99_08515 [Candidatus Korarchaeota archaeon]